MENNILRPKIITEIKTFPPSVIIVGDNSSLALSLREILSLKGVRIGDFQEFSYIFQLGDFEKTDFFLEKAKEKGAKFFLILDEDQIQKDAKKAEEKTLEFFRTKNLQGKIIKISGFIGEEVAPKILKEAFGYNPQRIVVLKGPVAFLEKKKKRNYPFKLEYLAYLFSIFFLMTMPVTFILANVLLGTLALKNTKKAILSSDFEKGRNLAKKTENYFSQAEEGFKKISPIFLFFKKEEKTEEIKKWLATGSALGRISGNLIEVGQEGQELILLILGQKQGRLEELITKISNNISFAQEQLALIEAQNLTPPPFFGQEFEQIKDLRKRLISFENFLGLVPWFLGKRTYLVLFQNNFELRPGGGFIGTIGILKFDDGRLDLKVEDVYTADGQLRGHVEPPAPIKIYLDQVHWYLRDSNWEPDFPTNAKKAAWFLEKELGIKPDGVIALDLSLVKKILSLTGPIYLPDYQEKVTGENLFLKAQIYSQEGFFPGSTQKRDFLGGLARAIFEKLTTEKNFPWLGLIKVAEEGAEEKHLFFFFEDPLAYRLISETGWGGEIRNIKYQISNIKYIDDYLMIVEANLGVNKVNYFIKRQIAKEVNLSQDSLTSKITIVYQNTSPPNIAFGGQYKNYLRVLTPLNSILGEVKIDDQVLSAEKIVQENSFGKQATGFLVEVPPGGKKTVVLEYKISLDPSWKDFNYQLLVQKQAGTDKDPFNLSIFTPSWQILETNFPTIVKGGSLSYNGDLQVDRQFSIKIRR